MSNSQDKRTTSAEQRLTTRIMRQESVSVQVLRPSLESGSSAEVVASETIDVSEHGLRLLLPEALERDRIIDICIQLRDDPKRFLLTGETRWCRYNSERQAHEVGIEILDGEQTDYTAWSESVSAEPDER